MNKHWKLILIFIILIGLGLAVPGVRKVLMAPTDMVDAVSTGMEIKRLDAMISGFKHKFERWPTVDEFNDLVGENLEQDRGDTLGSNSLVDMWGQPYNYFRQGSGFMVTSMGPDQKPGTTDDIILLRRK